MDVGALSLLIQEQGFADTMEKAAILDRTFARIGAKQTDIRITAPTVAGVEAAIGALGAETAKLATPVVIPVSAPNVGPAVAALGALAEAQALQQQRSVALSASLAAAGAESTTVAERVALLRTALDQDTASTEQLSAAARSLSIAEREGTEVLRLRVQATNELIAAQNELSRSQGTGARVRGALGPQLGPATPEAEALAARSRATAAAFEQEAAAAQRAAAANATLATQTGATGAAAATMSPKVRSASNALSILAFGAATGEGSIRGMTSAAGLATSALLEAFGPASVAVYASGIGAAVIAVGTLIAVLHDAAKAAPVTKAALDHLGNIDRIESAQAAIAKLDGQIKTLQDRVAKGADTDLLSRLLHERADDVSVSQDVLDSFGLSSADFRRLQTKLAEREALVAKFNGPGGLQSQQTKAVAAAQREAAVSAANDQLAITTSLIDRQESLNSQGYALGLVNLRQYFDTREQIARDRSQATIRALEAERKALSTAPVGEKPDEAIARTSRRDSVGAQIEAELNRQKTATQAFMAEREAAERALAQKILAYQRQIMEAQGLTHSSRMSQIQQESEEFQRTIALQTFSTNDQENARIKAEMVRAFRLELEAAERIAEVRRQTSAIEEQMGRERAIVQAQVESGQLNEQQGAEKIAELEQRRVPILREIARQMLVIGSITKNPELIAAAQQMNVELENLGKNLELAGFKKSLAQNVADTITDGITSGITAAVQSGSIGKGFLALAGGFLYGLGGLFITIGKRALVGLAFIQKIVDAIWGLNPAAGLAASLGLIAFGAILQAMGGQATGASQGGGGGGGRGASGGSSSLTAPTIPTTRVVLDPVQRLRDRQAVAPTVAASSTTRAAAPPRPVHVTAQFFGTPNPQAVRFVADAVALADGRKIPLTRKGR
jgi:hypothetical protein